MAEVDTVNLKEVSGSPGRVVGNCALTGATSTLGNVTHKLGTLLKVIVNVRGTNTLTKTVSGTAITLTGTNNDVVDFDLEGYV